MIKLANRRIQPLCHLRRFKPEIKWRIRSIAASIRLLDSAAVH